MMRDVIILVFLSCFSDEIPVCLRVPSAIAEATSRQQLRSLALLGQGTFACILELESIWHIYCSICIE
jgi:hypothetical protein